MDAWIVMRGDRYPDIDEGDEGTWNVPVLVCYDEELARAFQREAEEEIERMRSDLTAAYEVKIAARMALGRKRPRVLPGADSEQARANVRPSRVDGLTTEGWGWDGMVYRVVGPVPIRGPS